MRNISKFSFFPFVLMEFVSAVIVDYVYVRFVFETIPHWDEISSLTLLVVIIIVSAIIGALCTIELRRNLLSIFINTVLPIEIYTVIQLNFTSLDPISFVILLVTAVLVISFCAMVLLRETKKGYRYKDVMNNRIMTCIQNSRTIVALCLLLLLIPISAESLGRYEIVEKQPAQKYEISAYQDGCLETVKDYDFSGFESSKKENSNTEEAGKALKTEKDDFSDKENKGYRAVDEINH